MAHLNDRHAAAAPVEELLADAFEDGNGKRSRTGVEIIDALGGAGTDGGVSHGVSSSFVWRSAAAVGCWRSFLAFQNSRCGRMKDRWYATRGGVSPPLKREERWQAKARRYKGEERSPQGCRRYREGTIYRARARD